jgi:AraC-like DNA-binding protein
VRFVALAECLVSGGYRLELAGVNAPGIHYNLVGTGRAVIGDRPPVSLLPHTLIVVPPNSPFRIEVPGDLGYVRLQPVDVRLKTARADIRRFTAGAGPHDLILVCGYFHATYGGSTDLFANLDVAIVEQFQVEDQVDAKLQAALKELIAQEIGSGAMSAALLKQVIVLLLRRSLVSISAWIERFAILSDARIARAFGAMAARPGEAHTVQDLADLACLSRSAFMARFTEIVGEPPMRVLRDLRLRQAMQQIRGGKESIKQIARASGYASRSSFIKAFRKAYGVDPSGVRRSMRNAQI